MAHPLQNAWRQSEITRPLTSVPEQNSDDTATSQTALVRARTRIISPPLVPEIRLHLADASIPIWRQGEDELAQQGLVAPYWAFAWAGGQALARYILDNPGVVAGRDVLDLGAGSGLVGIAARMAGARDVLAADIDPLAVTAIELNSALNAVSLNCTTTDITLQTPLPDHRVVLIGDLFYDTECAGRVLSFANGMAAAGCPVFAGDPGRAYFPKSDICKLASYSVPVTRDLEDTDIRTTAVWRLSPPGEKG